MTRSSIPPHEARLEWRKSLSLTVTDNDTLKTISGACQSRGPLTGSGRGKRQGLFPAPVGHEVVAYMGQLVLLGAIGQHCPDLAMSADLSLKDDVPAVWGPGGKIVAAGLMGELQPTLAGDIHDVDVLPARRARPVFAIPTEGEHGSVGSPGRRDRVASIRQALDVGSVLIHCVDL